MAESNRSIVERFEKRSRLTTSQASGRLPSGSRRSQSLARSEAGTQRIQGDGRVLQVGLSRLAGRNDPTLPKQFAQVLETAVLSERVPGIEADAGNPAQEKEASMYAMTSYFSMPEDTDWDEMRRLAQERAVPYQSVPGMRSKAFIVDTERGLYGANYVWESKQAAVEFLESELFRGIVERLGQPDLHVMEVPAYLEEGEIVFSVI